MKDTQTVTIILLCVSGAILLALLVLTASSRPAAATGIGAPAGEYIMFTGRAGGSTEMLYIIDLTRRRLNGYYYDGREQVLDLKHWVDLKKAFTEKPPK